MVETAQVIAEAERFLGAMSYTPLSDDEVARDRLRTASAQHENDMERLAKADWEDPLFDLLHANRLPADRWQEVFLHLSKTTLRPSHVDDVA